MNEDLAKDNCIDDELNFLPLVENISKGILNHVNNKDKKSLTLSIEGDWGSGKTTFKNFLLKKINGQINTKNLEVINFNPWLITDIGQVIKIFFTELEKAILYHSTIYQKPKYEQLKKDFRKLLSIILPDDLSINTGIVNTKYNINNRLSENKLSLYEIKENINKNLKELDISFIIVIDDIDRLTDDETALIFRLVKGLADFDNITYLLLYDKKIVSDSLSNFKSENGERYLEKIVQYSISVPKATDEILMEYLKKRIQELDTKIKIPNEDVLLLAINYIKNLREIKQLINILRFEYNTIKDDVNFRDFFLLSIIKLKQHKLYDYIKNNPYNFYKSPNDDTQTSTYIQRNIQENFDKSPKEYQIYKSLLKITFPLLRDKSDTCTMASTLGDKDEYTNEKHYDSLNNEVIEISENEYSNKYICNHYYFDNYFSFSISSYKLSDTEFQRYKSILISDNNLEFKDILDKLDINKTSKYFIGMFMQSLKENKYKQIEIKNALDKMDIFFEYIKNDKNQVDIYKEFYSIWYNLIKLYNDKEKFILSLYKDIHTIYYPKISYYRALRLDNDNDYEEATINKIKQNIRNRLESLTFNELHNYCNDNITIVEQFKYFDVSIEILKSKIDIYLENNIFYILDMFKFLATDYKNMPNDIYAIDIKNLSIICNIKILEGKINKLDKNNLDNNKLKLIKYWENSFKNIVLKKIYQ